MENVFFTKHMDIKIRGKFIVCYYSIDKSLVLIFNIDFGLALDSQHQISDTCCGSYSYCVPVVILGCQYNASKQIHGACKYLNTLKNMYIITIQLTFECNTFCN